MAAALGTVRSIEAVYEAHGFEQASNYEFPESGVRRAACDAAEQTADLADPTVQERLARVYVDGVEDWGRRDQAFDEGRVGDALMPEARALVRSLQRDGFAIDDDAQMVPAGRSTEMSLDRFERLDAPRVLLQHLERIQAGISQDPAAAIASAKELVESTCKFVLDDYGVSYKRSATLPDLYKSASAELGISRDSVPGSDAASRISQRILQQLATAVQGLAELRNEIGLGHGRTEPSPALARHARLAANSARTVVEFMLETWHVRKQNQVEAGEAPTQ